MILDDSGAEVGEIQHLIDMRYDVRTQLDELAKAFEKAIVGERPELMVIRLGRIHIWDSRKSTAGPRKSRGGLAGYSRDNGVHVLAMDEGDIAKAVGGDRSSVDKAARTRATKAFVEAGSAALAAHSIAQRGSTQQLTNATRPRAAPRRSMSTPDLPKHHLTIRSRW